MSNLTHEPNISAILKIELCWSQTRPRDYKTVQRNNKHTYRTSCGKQLGSRPASSTESIHRVFRVGTRHASNTE